MKYIITAIGTDLTEGMQQATYKAFEKIDKSIEDREAVLKINLKAEKNRHRAEAAVQIGKHIIRAEAKAFDMYDAIKQAAKLMMLNIRKNKEKMLQIWHEPVKISFEDGVIETTEEEIEIAKEKKIELDMMTPEEACLQLDMIGHDFYMFLNSETNTVSTAYKRADGKYGILIAQ